MQELFVDDRKRLDRDEGELVGLEVKMQLAIGIVTRERAGYAPEPLLTDLPD